MGCHIALGFFSEPLLLDAFQVGIGDLAGELLDRDLDAQHGAGLARLLPLDLGICLAAVVDQLGAPDAEVACGAAAPACIAGGEARVGHDAEARGPCRFSRLDFKACGAGGGAGSLDLGMNGDGRGEDLVEWLAEGTGKGCDGAGDARDGGDYAGWTMNGEQG